MKKNLQCFWQLMFFVAILSGSQVSYGQGQGIPGRKPVPQVALDHINKNKQKLELADEDVADLELSSETESKKIGVKHYYIKQLYQGIEIHGAITNISIGKEGEVLTMGNRFHKEVGKKVKGKQASLSAEAAVAAAAKYLNTSLKESLTVKERGKGRNKEVLFSKGGISLEPIPAKLVYQPMEDGSLRLAWEVSIYELDAQNWWNLRLDASTGELLDKDNMVVHCQFENDGPGGQALHENHSHSAVSPYIANVKTAAASAAVTNGYSVFPMPSESPSHGPRAIVSTSAADASASPNGWQIETRTRGNNVFAYEDPTNNNSFATNYSPDGGLAYNFDFPVDFTKQPVVNRDAAITNLFYWNNIIHDVWYQYGFDEASGSFQLNNNGTEGLGGDPVLAEAQDSRNIPTTRNNANFATPVDGRAPRMQMYLWSSPADPGMFRVVSPAAIAGTYIATQAAWARQLTSTPLTGKLVVATDASTQPDQGCGQFSNAEAIAGNIAVVYRGTCAFTQKVENAQAAGAIAVVVINNAPGDPIPMGGTPTTTITIPAVMIGQSAGALIRDQLNAGEEVTVALKDEGKPEIDGDFDNGIITHEYGHGISNRLTGGPNNTSCLASAYKYPDGSVIYTEQMGEGWSDWFGLMMTMKPGDTAGKVRGIGTYAQGQATDGKGIRPAPYSTDFGINSYTYAATNNPAISAPHGVGFVWSTMLWDMTWAMIDKYGYDADLYNGKGGNNMAMQLVIDGLKLQACNPGFVDGRDAILAADRMNYEGANQELIWRVFAKRGLGYSADQGSNFDRFDQKEAFDVHPMYACVAPTIAVKPSSTVYTGGDAKTIYLSYGPQSVTLTASGDPTFAYTWAPAAELSSTTIANPVFKPTKAGTYTLTVTAVNGDNCTRSASVTIKVIDVRCGAKSNKVMVCVDGENKCVDTKSVNQLLTKAGGKLGNCSLSATATAAAVAAEGASAAEKRALLVVPNPFSSSANVEFTVAQEGNYRLELRDMRGALVSVLAEGNAKAEEHLSVALNRGKLAEGLYVVRLVTAGEAESLKVMIRK